MAGDGILAARVVNNQAYNASELNIAQANDPGAAAVREVVAHIPGSGPRFYGFQSLRDHELDKGFYGLNTTTNFHDELHSFFQKIDGLLGQEQAANNISLRFADVFNTLEKLQNADQRSSRELAVGALKDFISFVGDVTRNLQDYRFEADRKLAAVLNTDVNDLLRNIKDLNTSILTAEEKSPTKLALLDSMNTQLGKLSEYLGFYVVKDDKGGTNVLTHGGQTLVNSESAIHYGFQYTPLASSYDRENELTFSPVYHGARTVNLNGNFQFSGHPTELIPSGTSEEIRGSGFSGKVGALLKVRDEVLPNLMDQLDNFVHYVTHTFNEVHNNGTGFSAATTLTGDARVGRNDEAHFEGNIRIALLDKKGNQITRVEDKDTDRIRAFDLNFDKLDTGSGAGSANMHGIVQEIGYFYGERIRSNMVEVAGLSDIRLVSTQTNFTLGGTVDFAIESENYSGKSVYVEIDPATLTVLDSGAAVVAGSSIQNNSDYIIPTGGVDRTDHSTTGSPIVRVTLPALTGGYPITVRFDATITSNGVAHPVRLTYTIAQPVAGGVAYKDPDDINGMINKRYMATAAVEDPGGAATSLINSSKNLGGSLVTPEFIDDDNSFVAIDSADTTLGRLRLTGGQISSSDSAHIAIDSRDSQQLYSRNIHGEYANFSQFFGLNNLFVRTDNPANVDNKRGAASYTVVRPDIVENNNILSVGKLTLVAQPRGAEADGDVSPIYRYEIADRNTENLPEMLQLRQKTIEFEEVRGIEHIVCTSEAYLARIRGHQAGQFHSSAVSLERHTEVSQSYKEKILARTNPSTQEEQFNLVSLLRHQMALTGALKVQDQMFKLFLDVVTN
jgi:flagellar hook-associated protein FlgK